MITIVFKMRIKEEKVEKFKSEVTKKLTDSAHTNNSLQYDFYQNLENLREFMLHEKWESKKNWDGHLKTLINIFGEKAENSILPKALEEYFETTESIVYNEE